jgi:hypothetical protein
MAGCPSENPAGGNELTPTWSTNQLEDWLHGGLTSERAYRRVPAVLSSSFGWVRPRQFPSRNEGLRGRVPRPLKGPRFGQCDKEHRGRPFVSGDMERRPGK